MLNVHQQQEAALKIWETEAMLRVCGLAKPSVILAHTVKGKGISFMENNILWHYRTPQGEEYDAALKELEAIRP